MEEQRDITKLTENQEKQEKIKGKWKDFFKMGEVGGYFFRAKDPNRPINASLKMMHGVNKLSILMFLACVIIIMTRIIVRNYF